MKRRTVYRLLAALNLVVIVFLINLLAMSVAEGNHLLVLLDLALIALNAWILRRNWNELRAMRTPIPPTDVQIITDDGRTEAVQCVYRCFDGDLHRWEVITPDWFTFEYTTTHDITIRCAVLPPWTAIDATTVRVRPNE